ncbi:type VI secretion system protein ImpL [Enterobacter cloacae]|uniref:Type VI secretion system protein ImpL n=1 Tax=Enterobacter cloacae TaxID=550 RepID=A0A377M102_ENTCL|nr:type VI secretion system protein ImpL [Enterobacter cloacae]
MPSFANGATTPSFKVTVRTVRMDNTILNLTLDVDGQLLRYSHGPQAVQIHELARAGAAPTRCVCSWVWPTAAPRRW